MGKNKTLKQIIHESGMTHQQIADALGVKQPNISTWLRPGKDIRISNAVKLARLLNVSLKTLAASVGVDTEGVPDDKERDDHSSEG